MGRLAGHPVANFVCARVMERANQEQTEIVVEEIPPALEGIIENSRTGVLKALLEKTAEYKTGEEALNKVGVPLWLIVAQVILTVCHLFIRPFSMHSRRLPKKIFSISYHAHYLS